MRSAKEVFNEIQNTLIASGMKSVDYDYGQFEKTDKGYPIVYPAGLIGFNSIDVDSDYLQRRVLSGHCRIGTVSFTSTRTGTDQKRLDEIDFIEKVVAELQKIKALAVSRFEYCNEMDFLTHWIINFEISYTTCK